MFRLVATLFILGFLLLSQTAHACSCAQGGYWVSEFVEDKVIFEGQVLQTKWLGKEKNGYPSGNSETSFKIIKSLLGQTKSRTVVRHHSDGAACGMLFVMGSDSVVIANEANDGALRTNSCTSNAVPESTLLDYFEKGIDQYIPSWRECPEEQIDNKKDPKNCNFWSEEAAEQRQEAMIERWRKKRDATLKKKKN